MKQLIGYFLIALLLAACVEITVKTSDSTMTASKSADDSENIDEESSSEVSRAVPTGSNSDKMVALVIGNKDYEYKPLNNTINDATDIAKALKEIGFTVILKSNLDQRGMDLALREFGSKLRTERGVGLFYYSGHGARVDGDNYLIPVDNRKIQQESDLKYYAIHAHKVLETMKKARNNFNIVILDACRNDPFKSMSKSVQRGLAAMSSGGSLIAFATDQGKTASDNSKERNGLYTKHLLKALRKAAKEHTRIDDMFTDVRNAVFEASNGKQEPWMLDSLKGKFCFGGCRAISLISTNEQVNGKVENESATEQNSKEEFDRLHQKAKQGDKDAQANLGYMYREGKGISQDYQQAVYWSRKAAEQGHAYSQANLGYMYSTGKGVPKDYKQAIYWYRKAAEQGDAGGQNNLGVSYYNGTGVPKDYQQAIYWFRKAAKQDNEDAQDFLRSLGESW